MSTSTAGVTQRIDDYIASAPDYARTICRKLRRIVHKADPGIVEEWKWGGPVFSRDGLVCGLAAFKQHVALHFFKGSLLDDPHGLLECCKGTEHSRRVYLRQAADADEKTLLPLVRQAVRLNREGAELPKKRLVVRVPAELKAALDGDAAARRAFDALAPGYRREYAEHVAGAKRDDTRQRRVAKTIELLREGRTLHDRYR